MPTSKALSASLTQAGWTRVSADNWRRPGTTNVHSWPVAEMLVGCTDAPIPTPPPVERKPPKPGFQMRGSNRSPKARREPASYNDSSPKSKGGRPVANIALAAQVANLRDGRKWSFKEIGKEIGYSAAQAHYLYNRHHGRKPASKSNVATGDSVAGE